mmetsp:Transcript_15913/g.67082  ORF Transcript_15913/g.67082 Transcript_15913/m.67082 type:complete len:112 (-) Transcript_15913:1-336(-)
MAIRCQGRACSTEATSRRLGWSDNNGCDEASAANARARRAGASRARRAMQGARGAHASAKSALSGEDNAARLEANDAARDAARSMTSAREVRNRRERTKISFGDDWGLTRP